MKRIIILVLAAVAVFASCKRSTVQPRPTIPLVLNVSADTVGAGRVAADAGSSGPAGSIAIIGEPLDAIALARYFQSADRMDNVDGRPVRDSLPDFAGEIFEVILDDYNEPYSHFVTEGPDAAVRLDSLREAAVQNALFAWDSTCVRTSAKILVYTSSLQAEYGLFDVDTLQQLTGGRSILLSPVHTLLDQAYEGGARHMVVWTSEKVRKSGAWQAVFERKGWKDATLAVITPEPALDIRTEFRSLLRQYRALGRNMDVLLLDSYDVAPSYLRSELELIRQAGTEEDNSFNRLLSKDFRFMEPKSSLIQTTYSLLRNERLFTHRIARPAVRYYETDESDQGQPMLEEVSASYVKNTYVPDIH